jgi:hypothetical protein
VFSSKAYEVAQKFSKLEIQIFCSYWPTDFAELHWQLSEAGQCQARRFLNLPNICISNKQCSFEKLAA